MGRTNTNWLSAPLVIYHPTPRSSTTSQLLSKPSTFEGSVAATAGIKRTVTASVAKDEEMWRSWLMAESDKEESSVWPVDSQSDEPVPDGLSPSRNTGQSISPRSSFTDRSGSVVCRNDESVHGKRPIRSISTFSSSATGCPDGENSGNHDIIPSLGTVGTSKPRGAANDCIQLPNTPQNWKRKEKNQGFAWKAFVLAEPSENPDVIVQLSKKVAQEDTDLAWKKFVLSSDFNDERTTFSTENEEESKTTASNKRMQRSPSKISLQAHAAKTAIHLEPRLDHSSDTTSARVIYHPSTEFAAPRSLGSEANSRFSKPSMHANGSVHEASQAPRMLSQAAGKPLKWVTDKQGNPGDPLAQYMPQQSQSERDIFMAKKAQLPAPDESFERGLDDSLKQALHLGRRYAKQEKERYVKQNKEIYSKREKERCTKRRSKETRDIYDIPISDDTEEMDDE
ncbi:hypothetical protein V493_06552 [Pseudogymnoascus sp. VKM F-4281 (FW-2241)]|nr:hypothetical protein V493_06552 [Pseudogymnoascus sp. VKM F-4281 (FW-2241)]